jgi:hypothetical protein
MSIYEARCTYQGRTFFGVFDVAGNGSSETISVRYNGDELEAQTGGQAPEAIAGTLLHELVVRKEIADKVSARMRRA